MLQLFKVFMSEDVLQPVNKVLMSGQLTQGPQVQLFETKLKEYIGCDYLLTLNNATAGLTLATRLLKNPDDDINWCGFNDDDVVLTPALTCFATTTAILANNVNIRWIDSDLKTGNICLTDLESKLNEKTKIIYILHWGGTPVDMDKLDIICDNHYKKYGFRPYIVEDCAHAFGAEYNNKKIGNSKNICVFSLQAIKHLTTGDGGIITLPNEKLYERCKLLRWYGINRDKRNYKGKDFRLENDIVEWGYKFHMNDVNATIGLYNLPHIDNLVEKNRNNFNYYNENLKDLKHIRLMEYPENIKTAGWLYTLRILNNKKQDFINFMKEHCIMTSQVHNRNDINSCVIQFKEKLPNLDILENELVCIPVGWWLTEENINHIINSIKLFSTNN